MGLYLIFLDIFHVKGIQIRETFSEVFQYKILLSNSSAAPIVLEYPVYLCAEKYNTQIWISVNKFYECKNKSILNKQKNFLI